MVNSAIFGVPRSGTSWLGQICNSSPHVAYRYQPLFSYEFKDFLPRNPSEKQIQQFHHEILRAKSDFVLQNKFISGKKGITFAKAEITHLVWKEVRYLYLIPRLLEKSKCKLILIIRHPLAVLNSWFQTKKEFDPSWSRKEEWYQAQKKNADRQENYYGFKKWMEACELFLNAKLHYSDRCILIQYEDVLTDTLSECKKVCQFLDLEMTDQSKSFISKSKTKHSDDPYSVFKGKKTNDSAWEKHIPDSIREKARNDEKFQKLNRNFQYKL